MELKDGTSVFTKDGKEAGRFRRLVVNPQNNELTHIVIAEGFLFTDNKVVPIEYVASATDDCINLNCSSQDVAEMSPLDIESSCPEQQGSHRSRTYIPAIGRFYMNPVILPPMSTEVRRSIASNLVALDEGVDVTSDDDEHLGSVESYFTVAGGELVDCIIVSDGILNKTRKSVKLKWVKTISDDEIQLCITAEQYGSLPELIN
jgi:uncharacterized protein YrrD